MQNKKTGCWNIIRWIVSVFLILIILVTIFVGIPLSSVSKSLTSRNNLKNYLTKSGVYENISQVIVQMIPKKEIGQEVAIIEMISKVITPEHAKKNIEGAIDGIYDWLEGKTEQPIFEISIIPEGMSFNQALNNIFKDLPECSSDESFNLQEGESFKLDCRPKGLDLGGLNLNNFEESFGELKIKSTDIPFSAAWLKRAQGIFFFMKYSPIFLGLYILVLIGLLILTMPGLYRGRGLIISGIILFIPGILYLIIGITGSILGFNFIFNFFRAGIAVDFVNAINSLMSFVNLIYIDIMARIMHYSIIVVVFSIVLFNIGMVMRAKAATRQAKA